MKQKLLWLDDIRDPATHQRFMVPYILLDDEVEVIWVKNYDEFVEALKKGPYDQISFDHDLADEHYDSDISLKDYKEKTGFDCLEFFLKNHYHDNDKVKLTFHTQSTVGFLRMKDMWKTFILNEFKF